MQQSMQHFCAKYSVEARPDFYSTKRADYAMIGATKNIQRRWQASQLHLRGRNRLRGVSETLRNVGL